MKVKSGELMYFYSHYIELDTLINKLEEMDLPDHHKHHLALLIDSTFYHTILDLILSQLAEEDKKVFLHKLKQNPADPQLMGFLTEKVEDIEEKIRKVAQDLKEQLHEDIQKASLLKKRNEE